MRLLSALCLLFTCTGSMAQLSSGNTAPQVKTTDGILEGVNAPGLSIFKGIPFAAPPIGLLRWKEPQPVQPWKGIRKADMFGPRAMQRPIYSDMMFRSNGVSEDCLYLNVWTPAHSAGERLPVLVYFYGGGLMAGDGSEYRYEGESMARKGIVALTVNYRLGIFGFMAHPELTKESPHHASGNYGFMDQAAALQWVKKNIAAFGGDPDKITIAGESAGSFSVSALMASPMSRTLISGAIGESGSLLGSPLTPLAEAEQKGLRLQELADVHSLIELRRIPAERLQQIAANHEQEIFTKNVDGYFFPSSPMEIYAAGQQAQVPLLVGWNSQENNYRSILGNEKSTVDNYTKAVQQLYGDKAAGVLNVYAAATDADVQQVATDLASDRAIGFGTWKWSDIQSTTGSKPVYRYMYCHPRPRTISDLVSTIPPPSGAVHSAEIEYAMGNLSTNPVYNWQPEDYKVSELMQSYFANFIRTGDPNGPGIPAWHPVKSGGPAQVMFIDVTTKEETEQHRDRYSELDQLLLKK